MADGNDDDENDFYSSSDDDFDMLHNRGEFQRLTRDDINFVTEILDDLFLGASSKLRVTQAPEFEGFRYPLLS